MTRRDEVIRMAQEAGFVAYGEDMGEYRIPVPAMHSRLERFAALVAKEERERCALIANAARDGYADRGVNLMACAADYIVCAIRALVDEVSE